MDDLGLERYCCRALFLGHVDLLKDIDVSICDVINQRDEDWYE